MFMRRRKNFRTFVREACLWVIMLPSLFNSLVLPWTDNYWEQESQKISEGLRAYIFDWEATMKPTTYTKLHVNLNPFLPDDVEEDSMSLNLPLKVYLDPFVDL